MATTVSAQISVYPLREKHLSPAIESVKRSLARRGLEPKIGLMSTLVSGECELVFGALREAFEEVATKGDVVMAVTLSNTCPLEGHGADALGKL